MLLTLFLLTTVVHGKITTRDGSLIQGMVKVRCGFGEVHPLILVFKKDFSESSSNSSS